MPTLADKSHAEYLCNVLNKHIRITEVDGDGECLLTVNGELAYKTEDAMSDLLWEMFEFANRVAPKGTAVWVTETGFELREVEQ